MVLKINTWLLFFLTNVYGPTDDSQKANLRFGLYQTRALNDLPWIITGDFNLIRSISKTTRGNFNLGLSMTFNECIEDLNLIEISLLSRTYTWSNKWRNPTFSKLDIVFWSCHGVLTQGSYIVPTLSDILATTSDHVPLKLLFSAAIDKPKRKFKFERY